MDAIMSGLVATLESKDDTKRLSALKRLLSLTESTVGWAEEVWDRFVLNLDNENSYQRSIAIMMLCNLAKSAAKDRVKGSLGRLLEHTADEKFITSRQCIQNIWKVAVTDAEPARRVTRHLEQRFGACKDEKHANLLRQDIVQSLSKIARAMEDLDIAKRLPKLIQTEENEKYRKKYMEVL